MPIDPDSLSSFATNYAKDMTSIRGRRVQRLLKREFADADYVLLARVGSGMAAALGLSASGAALCATNGTGKQATVFKWSHGSTVAQETHFDLYKDSLPALGTNSLPVASLRTQVGLHLEAGSVPPEARALADKALKVMG